MSLSGAERTRRWRARRNLRNAVTWQAAHPRLERIRVAMSAWFGRGLQRPPTQPQLVLLAPLLMAHTDAARAAVAAMPRVPQVGTTYPLVGAMVAAARAVLHAQAKYPPPTLEKTPPPGGSQEWRAAGVTADELEADRSGADRPVESYGARPEPRPTGLAAWRALREPGGILYEGPPTPDPSRRDRVAIHRARVRHMRRAAYRSLS